MQYRARLKSFSWIVIFFVILATLLIPTIILGGNLGFEITVAIQAAIILAATAICQIIRKENFSNISGTINKYWLRQFGRGCLLGLKIMVVPAMALYAIGAVNFKLNAIALEVSLNGFFSCAAVAVAEEFLFRGFLFQRSIQSFGKPIAQILISSLFLLTHVSNPGITDSTRLFAMTNIFIASLLFGMAFIRTASLALPIGIHFMANFVQGTVMGFGVSGTHDQSIFTPIFHASSIWLIGSDFGLEASAPGLITIALVSFLFWNKSITRSSLVRKRNVE